MTLSLLAVGRTCRLVRGDSGEVLRGVAPNSIDAMVTDPPSGIGFMGVEWDRNRGGRDEWVTWLRGIMELALAALRPGAHALVWALPKRSHWTALAVEDSGFEIRDVHHHLFGEGFPKSGAQLKPAVEHCAKPSGAERTAAGQVDNDHPTIKSITLMSWLVRLITPPGGTVLDPFAGSGTTGLACAAEGMSFIGIEQDDKYYETARKRLHLAYGEVLP